MRVGFSCSLIVSVSILLFSFSIEAQELFLNGRKISGIKNQTFQNVKVTVDSKGDVYIFGQHYKVKLESPVYHPTTQKNKASKGTTHSPQKKYVFVFRRTQALGSGYALRLEINNQVVHHFKLNTEQDVLDVTRYLKKGTNQIVLEVHKKDSKAMGGMSVILSEGHIQAGEVVVKKPYLVKYSRKSSDKDNFRHVYTIDAK